MLELFDHLSPLGDADCESTWCENLWDIGKQFGFERTLIAVVPRPIIGVDNAYLRSNYSDEWRQNYDKHHMAHIDPTVEHCLTRTSPLIWSPELFSSREQKAMYEEASAYGLRAGVTLPIHGPKGEVGMLSFVTDAKPSPALWLDIRQHLADMVLVRDIAFDTGKPYVEGHAEPSLPTLTPRERECLQWTARGKSTWDIANIFRCSESAVDFHMANIRQKFGVSSRRAAAVRAVQLGLIDPS